MKTLLMILFLGLTACGVNESSLREKVHRYGESQFTGEVLDFEIKKKLSQPLLEHFSPKYTRSYLGGVLLVYEESDRSVAGIYVDRGGFEGMGGSGLSIEPWGPHIAWLEDKQRTLAK